MYLSVHALVADYADCKVVNRDSVVLSAHDLRSYDGSCKWLTHVTGRPAGVLAVLWRPDARDSKVCNAQVALMIEHEVFWLDISVNDAVVVYVFKSGQKARNKKLYTEQQHFTNRHTPAHLLVSISEKRRWRQIW